MHSGIESDQLGKSSHGHEPVTDFVGQVVQLCRLLEKWNAEQRAIEAAKTGGFPVENRKSAVQALVFAGLAGITFGELALIPQTNASHLIGAIALLGFTVTGAYLFLVKSQQMLTAQYWRAAFGLFKMGDYPFAPLIYSIERDARSTDLLAQFPTAIIAATNERMTAEESELRDRLNAVIGSPTLLVIGGLIASIWSTWKSVHSEPNFLTISIFLAAIFVFVLAFEGARLRLALFDLTRCRSLLSFEIARRKAMQA